MLFGPRIMRRTLPPTTFDPANKGSSITLSGGNLSAAAAATAGVVRATKGLSSGKAYFEVRRVSGSVSAGAVLASVSMASSTSDLGSLTGAIGATKPDIKRSGSIVGSTDAFDNSGDWAGFALDLDARLFWVRDATQWNGGAANPATGSGGISIAALVGALYPAAAILVGASVTANFGASAFNYTKPSGFLAWDEA